MVYSIDPRLMLPLKGLSRVVNSLVSYLDLDVIIYVSVMTVRAGAVTNRATADTGRHLIIRRSLALLQL